MRKKKWEEEKNKKRKKEKKKKNVLVKECQFNIIIQCVPLATEPGISLIILPLIRILQRNLKQTYLIV